jgi:RNA polymerase sigma-70 factor (ECF subfamily)
MDSPGDITRLLATWAEGDEHAMEQLMPLVSNELHRIARRHWSSKPEDHTLQPTALIHEAFLKLVGPGSNAFQNRTQFYALASLAMRQVLVNHAEARLAQKRRSGHASVPLGDANEAVQKEAREVLALNDALKSLQAIDTRKSRVVELRYFGGLTIEETAEALNISAVTVTRIGRLPAWLARELGMGSAMLP